MDDAPPPAATDADTDVSEGSASSARLARFHLDPVGGIAGDMFAAALLDARPELADGLRPTALAGLGLPPSVDFAVDPHRDAALAGVRFKVTAPEDEGHDHVRLADVRARLGAARIEPAVRASGRSRSSRCLPKPKARCTGWTRRRSPSTRLAPGTRPSISSRPPI